MKHTLTMTLAALALAAPAAGQGGMVAVQGVPVNEVQTVAAKQAVERVALEECHKCGRIPRCECAEAQLSALTTMSSRSPATSSSPPSSWRTRTVTRRSRGAP